MYLVSRILLVLCVMIASLDGFSQSASKLVITTDPVPGSTNGGPMSVQPVVEVRDASDHLVAGSTAQVEITIASGAGGTIGGTTRIDAVNGVATFTDLTFTGVAGETYTFEFKSEPIIASDPFDYTGGTSLTGQNGGSGWSGAWFGPSSAFPDFTVDGAGLTYTGFSSSGGRAAFTSTNGADAARNLAATSNVGYDVIWLSFLGNYTQQGGGFSNVRLYLTSGTLAGGIGGNANNANWAILDNSLNATTFTSTAFDGSTHLALLKIDYTAGTSSLWMDPTVASFDGTQTASMTTGFAPVFDQIALYNRYSGVSTDEITLASTYKAALHLEQGLTSATSAAVVLPVKWTYFKAVCQDGHPLLEWGTGKETNNNRFVVEHSDDGIRWSVIGQVQGAGSSGIAHQYQFSDTTSTGTVYYRLRQVDLDGHSYFSTTISEHCKVPTAGGIKVFPNPATDVVYFTGAEQGLSYKLMDAEGRLLRSGQVQAGNNTISLDGLPAGSYFMRIDGMGMPVQVVKLGR
jgi:hypothetical protein